MNPFVLVVDDDRDVCELIARSLTLKGFHVSTVLNGEHAVQLLTKAEFDCVLVDKNLPGMHGFEVIAEVHRYQPLTAVVLMSAYPEPLTFQDERPDVTLTKPFASLQVIEEAVKNAIDAKMKSMPSLKERWSAVVTELAPGRKKRV